MALTSATNKTIGRVMAVLSDSATNNNRPASKSQPIMLSKATNGNRLKLPNAPLKNWRYAFCHLRGTHLATVVPNRARTSRSDAPAIVNEATPNKSPNDGWISLFKNILPTDINSRNRTATISINLSATMIPSEIERPLLDDWANAYALYPSPIRNQLTEFTNQPINNKMVHSITEGRTPEESPGIPLFCAIKRHLTPRKRNVR